MKKIIPIAKDIWDFYTIQPEQLIIQSVPLFKSLEVQGDQIVHIEIGSGNGHFLAHQAKMNPDIRYLGIDIKYKRVLKSVWKSHRLDLKNIKWMKADIGFVMLHLMPENSIHRYYLNFPDPWQKRKHYRRRLVQPAFITDIYNTLVPGGDLIIATDHMDYLSWMLLYFENDQRFRFVLPNKTSFEQSGFEQGGYYPSLYEERWRKENRLIAYTQLRKVESERETGLEPATFCMASRSSTN